MSGTLALIDAADKALAEARTFEDILSIRDKAEAVRIYAKAQKQSLKLQNKAADVKLRAERKAGELLRKMELQRHGRPSKKTGPTMVPVLDEIGITKNDSSRWQKESTVRDVDYAAIVKQCDEEEIELTQSLILKAAGAGHVSQSNAENEWYTPTKYIEAARRVMGGIDCDPASSELAQKTVKAKLFYDIGDDGLSKRWKGCVWLNPPYSKDLIGAFSRKLGESLADGDASQAIMLTNNSTDTAWFQAIAKKAAAVCLVQGRISFNDKNGKPSNKPLQGQVFIYFGDSQAAFVGEFGAFGVCFVRAG